MGSWANKLAAVLAALALTALPAAAQVPDPFARELAQALSRVNSLFAERGYAQAAGPLWGGILEGQRQRFSVSLRAGQDYRIVGVCERRCRDLNLRLVAPGGALIAQDVLEDAVPVMHVRPRVTGQYTVEAVMTRCTGNPCWFAFNVYSR